MSGSIEPETLIGMAEKQGWVEIQHKGIKTHVRLERGNQTLDVHTEAMSVGVSTNGGRAKWRKDVPLSEMTRILRSRRKLQIADANDKRKALEKQDFHHKDTDKMFEREHFDDPEAILVEKLWNLKPKWYHSRIKRSALKKRAAELAQKFIG